LITWEKGYKNGNWDDDKKHGEFVMPKYRNNSRDIMFFKFKYISSDWSKNNKLKQIIVKATNPKENTIEVSILTTDKQIDEQEVIRLMFKRWLQENDLGSIRNYIKNNPYSCIDSTRRRGGSPSKSLSLPDVIGRIKMAQIEKFGSRWLKMKKIKLRFKKAKNSQITEV